MTKNGNQKQQKICPGYYEVSGYTTKDGKHVEDYIRQCWKHGNGSSGSGNGVLNGWIDNPQKAQQKARDIYDDSLPNENQDTKPDLNDLVSFVTKFLSNQQGSGYGFSGSTDYAPNYAPKYEDANYQSFPFSTFDIKKTEEKIREATKNIEELLKNSENINEKSLNEIKNKISISIEGLCGDCEKIIRDENNQPKIPTWESVEKGKNIQKIRGKVIDNAPNAIIMLNLMDNVLNKMFQSVDSTAFDYEQQLQKHIKEKDRNAKIKNIIMNLAYSVNESKERMLDLVNKLRTFLGYSTALNQFSRVTQ